MKLIYKESLEHNSIIISITQFILLYYTILYVGLHSFQYSDCIDVISAVQLQVKQEWVVVTFLTLWPLQVCNNTSDRKHADTVLESYVTETVMGIVTTFFSSPFSDQSTSLQVTTGNQQLTTMLSILHDCVERNQIVLDQIFSFHIVETILKRTVVDV